VPNTRLRRAENGKRFTARSRALNPSWLMADIRSNQADGVMPFLQSWQPMSCTISSRYGLRSRRGDLFGYGTASAMSAGCALLEGIDGEMDRAHFANMLYQSLSG
jgi:hypothetical protein